MADSRKLVKVFLGSPGDLTAERQAAKAVVDEFNALWADEFGYQVELVGWEDTVSTFGRPQATINRELERCELFVGLMWKHWGTPPSTSGPYTSGFEEEFRTSVERRNSQGVPEISLFFKTIEQEFLRDPGDGLKKVLAFRQELIDRKSILFENFSNLKEFETKFHRCIAHHVKALRTKELDQIADLSQAPTTGGKQQSSSGTAGTAAESPFSGEAAKFLRDFILRIENDPGKEETKAVEVARFRLLANLVGSQGNDAQPIGVHDLNLLYTAGSYFNFGNREYLGIIGSSLEYYPNENAPLWGWFDKINGFERHLLPILTLMGPSVDRHIGALRAMTIIAEPLHADLKLDRGGFLDAWFAEDKTAPLKSAALDYLTDCGITADLEAVRKVVDGNDNQIARSATETLIAISLRDSREKAIRVLYELQPTSIRRSLLRALFGKGDTISTDLLMAGVENQSAEVRQTVVSLLSKRQALSREVAERLLVDSDADVRYLAMRSLLAEGRHFSEAEAKAILVKELPGNALSLLSFGDQSGKRCLEQFEIDQLRSLSDEELERAVESDSIFDLSATFVLAERHFNVYGEKIRKSIDDRYQTEFRAALARMEARYHGDSDLLKKTRGLETFTRTRHTRRALDLVCRQRSPQDLNRVRLALKSGTLDYSADDAEYLSSFGEWEDIPLIIESTTRSGGMTASLLLSGNVDSKYEKAAHAIYALGKNRLSEVLALSIQDSLLVQFVGVIPDIEFADLADVTIARLLRSDSDRIRKCSALKSVVSLSRERLRGLLDAYISSDEQHFYNVIHWLDFGIFVPLERLRRSARIALNKEIYHNNDWL